ncbi:phosphotransferase [Lentibacillus halodurans]|uniref:phosphotransferase n=1 Tax=Lentibacillus halodurans TaxID=237679 RepID=UPI00244EC7C9|nr:phosphotransferase [Lentibacillus halodurans]
MYPHQIRKISERLYQVSDGQHVYALKQSRLTKNTVQKWEQIYHQAYALNLPNILPVYLTRQSDLYVKMDDSYYYVTPWIFEYQQSREQAITNGFETIGNIHAKTKQSISIDTDSILGNFRQYRQKNAELQNILLDYVSRFEQNRFMSPFELQVCTHYHVLTRLLPELDDHTVRFMNELESDQKWTYCLCHGHLTLSHFLHHRHTYLINWEQAAYDHAVFDLTTLLHGQVRHYDLSPEQLVELFSAYNRKNPLNTSEKHLLTIYLLDPAHYMSLIDNYVEHPEQQTMIKRTQLLQSAFHQLELGLKWSTLTQYDDIPESESESEA